MEPKGVAVVAGGAGGIGEGIVFSLLTNGYRVYIPTREGDKSERLREYVGDEDGLHMIHADLSNYDDVSAFRDKILETEASIDAVIVSVGAYYYGHRMHRMSSEDWEQSIEDNLTTHFNLQRVFVEYLRERNKGAYVVLTGPEAQTIVPDEQVMSIMAAAQKMMARVVAHEAFDSMVRVYAITSLTGISTRSRSAQTNPDWIPARDLGSYVVGLIRGYVSGVHETLHELRDKKHLNAKLDQVRRFTDT